MDIPKVSWIQYNAEHCEVRNLEEGETPTPGADCTNWYDIRGLHDLALIEMFGRQFNIHPLALEDILHTQQRPKFEEYGDKVFIVANSLLFKPDLYELETEQITIYFGKNFLLTFQEKEDDTFSAVRERLSARRGQVHNRKSDYLAYALLDNIVDNYFQILDQLEDRIDQLETEINDRPDPEIKEKIHRLKFQMLAMRKAVMPLREAVGKFIAYENPLPDESIAFFVRDLYDHVIRVSDMLETYRDMLNGLQELYLSELSIRMNNVIQVLTIITTIFVPLTFLAGIYGMNFSNMPELRWRYGYYYLLALMLLVFIAFLLYFRKKKWI